MAGRDKLVAQPAPALALARQRRGELLASDLSVCNQDVAEARRTMGAVLPNCLPEGFDRSRRARWTRGRFLRSVLT